MDETAISLDRTYAKLGKLMHNVLKSASVHVSNWANNAYESVFGSSDDDDDAKPQPAEPLTTQLAALSDFGAGQSSVYRRGHQSTTYDKLEPTSSSKDVFTSIADCADYVRRLAITMDASHENPLILDRKSAAGEYIHMHFTHTAKALSTAGWLLINYDDEDQPKPSRSARGLDDEGDYYIIRPL